MFSGVHTALMWAAWWRKLLVSRSPRSCSELQNSRLRSNEALMATALAVATVPSACIGV